ncbi:MAG: cation:proton antiporter [Luminiphilus sp.]|jgi:Kef-type K+ transport system membrane component KefB|nr:cation:proton antiporter [Luminiphilus sp.]
METGITFTFAVIFLGAAVLSSLALYARQPIIIAYIALGMALGPHGLGAVSDMELVSGAGHVGIILLLFLLGLDMKPSALWNSLRQSTLVATLSAALFASSGYALSRLFGFTGLDAVLIAAALVFSSTIIGIKLLPTTVLHHRHLGELMIALLLFQDLLAIIVLVMMESIGSTEITWQTLLRPLLSLPVLGALSWISVKLVLLALIRRFDRFHEYIFLLSIGWCLGMAELAMWLGLSAEIGAFIAGISIASSPIAQYIAISLKPLRDFFLVVFFFSVGSGLDMAALPMVALPALVIAAFFLILKPVVFQILVRGVFDERRLGWNLGLRLGQCSEFALLIAALGLSKGLLGVPAATLIQATTILTLLVSSYWVVFTLPNPIAVREDLRRD